MAIIKYVFYFTLFFILFYLENFNITGNVSFSQAWKIPLIFFMIWYVIKNQDKISPKFNSIAYYLGIKNLFNQATLSNLLTNITETFRFSNFPLLYDTFNIYFKEPEKIQKFIIRISQYFILSNIPFLLGFIESAREGMQFGEDLSFIGIFQNSHSASIVTTFALLVTIYHIKTDRLSFFLRIFNLIVISLGIYCLYLMFVRTGYLMFVIGIIIIFFPSRNRIRQFFIFAFIIFSFGFIFYKVMETNISFRERILDQNINEEQRSIGSGRLDFAIYSLEYWAEGNFQQLLLGRGLDNVKDNLQRKTGMRIFSHNGFVDALAINGIIGIVLFLLFLYFMYNNIRKNKGSQAYRLALAMFFCYVSFQSTQGGAGFPIDLYMVSVINIINK